MKPKQYYQFIKITNVKIEQLSISNDYIYFGIEKGIQTAFYSGYLKQAIKKGSEQDIEILLPVKMEAVTDEEIDKKIIELGWTPQEGSESCDMEEIAKWMRDKLLSTQTVSDPQINSATNCPTCGSEVSIGGDDVTHFYIPKKQSVIDKREEEKAFTEKDFPIESKDDPQFSVDVIIRLEEMLNIGFYDFLEGCWSFHTDTLIDPKGKSFTWTYAPKII